MRILADTHVLLWWLSDSEQLGQKTLKLLQSDEHEVFFSAMSMVEIVLKQRIGKITLDLDQLLQTLQKQSIHILSYDSLAAKVLHGLPDLSWKDPFDLMLMAHATSQKLVFVTADRNILESNVQKLKVMDART